MVRKPAGVIAERFIHLQATIYPHGRGPYTLTEICEGINALAGEAVISKPFLSQIRSGRSQTPGYDKLAWIARFYGVNLKYFEDDGVAATVDESLALARALADHGVQALALRTQGMTPGQLREAVQYLDAIRDRDGLPGLPGQG